MAKKLKLLKFVLPLAIHLEADEGIVTVETDKASMDIPAPFAGELVSLTVKVGDKIKEGDVIAEMKAAGAALLQLKKRLQHLLLKHQQHLLLLLKRLQRSTSCYCLASD